MSSDKGPSQETCDKDWTRNSWALVLDTLARIARYFDRTELAKGLYLWASDVCLYERDYYGAAHMAEKAGDIERAIDHYINAGLYDKGTHLDASHRAKRLAERHGITPHHIS